MSWVGVFVENRPHPLLLGLLLALLCSVTIDAAEEAAPTSAHLLVVRLAESERTLPPWLQGKRRVLECVRLDLIQEERPQTFFLDKRPWAWWLDPSEWLPPYLFSVDVSGTGRSSFRPGRCTVVASRWGYRNWQRGVDLQPGAWSELRVTMERDPHFGLIVSPRLMSAVTRLPGEQFAIEVDAPEDARGWAASLSTRHFSVPLRMVKAEYGQEQTKHGAAPGWQLTAEIGSDTPEELYDLTVSCSVGESTQPNSVQVLLEYPDPMHIAGNFHHALDSPGPSADEEIAALFTQTVNVVHPLFYANVDDVGYEDERLWGRISYCLDRYLDVPYYHGLGNHDRGGTTDFTHYQHAPWPDDPASLRYYEYYCGLRYQSRDFGKRLHVILPYCPDQWDAYYPRPDQGRWMKADLLAHQDSDLRLITCHHPTWYHKPNEPWQITDLLDKQYNLDLVLVERGHRTEGKIHRGDVPTFYGGLCKSPELDKIGILEISSLGPDDPRNQRTLIEEQPAITTEKVDPKLAKANYSTAVEREVRLTTTDTYVAKGHLIRDCTLKAFSVEYSGPNDGSQTALTARVLRAPDDNPITIRGGRLKFVMKRGAYRCSVGEIIQQVQSDDGKKTIVYVKVDIVHPQTVVTVALP